MARQTNLLRLIHAVALHQSARGILGNLSANDLQVVAEHISNGNLMSALRPLKDVQDNGAAVTAMQPDIARVIAKLPDEQIDELRASLAGLPVDTNNEMVCGC